MGNRDAKERSIRSAPGDSSTPGEDRRKDKPAYANLKVQYGLAEFVLLLHRGIRGIMHNTPFEDINWTIQDVISEARIRLKENAGPFDRVSLYFAYNEGASPLCTRNTSARIGVSLWRIFASNIENVSCLMRPFLSRASPARCTPPFTATSHRPRVFSSLVTSLLDRKMTVWQHLI
jgi:hypothetical protein